MESGISPDTQPQEEERAGLFEKLIAVLLCRGDLGNEQLEARPVSTKELVRFRFASTRDTVFMAVGVALSAISGILMPMTMVLTGLIANLFLKTENVIAANDTEIWDQMRIYLIFYAVLTVLIFHSSSIQVMLVTTATNRIVARMRRAFLSAVLRQDAEFLQSRSAGELNVQLNENIDRIRDGIGDKLTLLVRGGSMFLCTIVASMIVNWRVTLIMLGTGPASAITMGLLNKFGAGPMRELMEKMGAADSLSEELVMNVKTLAACNGQPQMLRRYRAALDAAQTPAIRVAVINGFIEGAMYFMLYIFTAVGILVGVLLAKTPSIDMEPGTVLMAVNTVLLGAYFLGMLGPHMMALLKARISAALIYRMIDRQSTVTCAPRAAPRGDMKIQGTIEFRNVHFAYPKRDTAVLQGVSWKAERGESIAIVGHSGCGKSTSVALLTRLYDATYGQILIDNIDITEIHPKVIRKMIGIVMQEPYLFNGTIRENILLGRHVQGDEEKRLRELARIANALEFIDKLENGLDTLVGDGGVRLSGGQKQRIAIARALLTDPPILILDEATSALDSRNEQQVQQALKSASLGRTTIVIAHRLSTLRDVNLIHVLDKGFIVQRGTHEELLRDEGGLYSKLAKAQMFEKVADIEEDDEFERDEKKRMKTRMSKEHSDDEAAIMPLGRFGSSRSSALSSATNGRRKQRVAPAKVGEEDVFLPPSSSLLRLYTEGPFLKMIISQLLSLVRGLELPLFTFLLKGIYDTLEAKDDDYSKVLIFTCSFCVFLAVFVWITCTFAQLLAGWTAQLAVSQLKHRILSRVLAQPSAFFDRKETSNATIVTDLNRLSPDLMAGLDSRMVLIVNGGSAYVVCVVMALIFNWTLALIGLGISIVFIVIILLLFATISRSSARRRIIDTTPQLAIEMLEQTRTIQLMAVENYFEHIYEEKQRSVAKIDFKLATLNALVFSVAQGNIQCLSGIIFLIGTFMLYDGAITKGDLYIVAAYVEFFGWALFCFYPSIPDLIRADGAARVLYRYYDLPEEGGDLAEGQENDLTGAFSVDRIRFAYPIRPSFMVARGLSLSAAAGESISLVGPSGCGKSTLIGLLERFYTQRDGVIRMDGVDHRSLSVRHLRAQMALVSQEPVLFEGSIAENVRLGCEEETTLDAVVDACRQANAATFIEALPLKYDTSVGVRGGSLSCGQKQRVALARALVRKPRLLLLDEATSALDAQSEKIVQAALAAAMEGRTSVSIAHRLSSIQNVTRIYFIENGAVVESGNHEELMRANGRYAEFVRAQSLVDG